MNTDKLISTLQAPPCNWRFAQQISAPDVYAGMSPEEYASCQASPRRAIMRAAFAHDTPQNIAIRNMNYLLAFVAAAGAAELLPRLTKIINGVAADKGTFHYATSGIKNGLRINLDIDKQRSITTITVRPCRARAYEVKERAE